MFNIFGSSSRIDINKILERSAKMEKYYLDKAIEYMKYYSEKLEKREQMRKEAAAAESQSSSSSTSEDNNNEQKASSV